MAKHSRWLVAMTVVCVASSTVVACRGTAGQAIADPGRDRAAETVLPPAPGEDRLPGGGTDATASTDVGPLPTRGVAAPSSSASSVLDDPDHRCAALVGLVARIGAQTMAPPAGPSGVADLDATAAALEDAIASLPAPVAADLAVWAAALRRFVVALRGEQDRGASAEPGTAVGPPPGPGPATGADPDRGGPRPGPDLERELERWADEAAAVDTPAVRAAMARVDAFIEAGCPSAP